LLNARIDLAIPTTTCPHAAKFWKSCWGGDLDTSIEEFVQQLFEHKYIDPVLADKSKISIDFIERGIASLIIFPSPTCYSDVNMAKKTRISFYQFSNLLDWFGPLKGNQNSPPMIIHMATLLKADWFFGPMEKIEADQTVKRIKGSNYFLFRLNTGTTIAIDKAPFVITKENKGESNHIRVYPNGGYGKWICKLTSGEKVQGDSVNNLIENLKKQQQECIGNPVTNTPFRKLSHKEDNFHGNYGEDVDLDLLNEIMKK